MRIGPRIGGSLVAAGVIVAATAGVGIVSGMIERDGAFVVDRFDQEVEISADGSDPGARGPRRDLLRAAPRHLPRPRRAAALPEHRRLR